MASHCFGAENKILIMTCQERSDLEPACLARLTSQHFVSCSVVKLRKVIKGGFAI